MSRRGRKEVSTVLTAVRKVLAPSNTDEATVNGISIREFFRGLWHNLWDNPIQTSLAIIAAAVAAGWLLKKLRVGGLVTAISVFGVFWAVWQLVGWFAGDSGGLFPGGFQATDPFSVFFEEGNGGLLIAAAIFAGWLLYKLLFAAVNAGWKVAIAFCLLLGVSFFFNFIDGFRTPS